MPAPAIETQQLVRQFKKGPRAVDGIDLRVEPGEVYGFLAEPGDREAICGALRGAGQGSRRLGHAGAGRAPAEERLNDPALARKVESEIFRDQELPKSTISVNVEYGVVYFRGEVPDREQMDELVARARKVDGVRGVENLTHLPNEAGARTKSKPSGRPQGAAGRR